MPKKPAGQPKAAPEIIYKSDDLASTLPVKRARGIESKYTPELAAEICAKIAVGMSMFKIINEGENMPDMTTVYRWLHRYPDFALMYKTAREQQQHYFVDQMIEIADNKEITSDQKRVMIDARKWLAGKLAPNSYGERTITEHHGPGGGPMQVNTTVIDANTLDPEHRAALKQALLAAKGK